VLVLFFEKNMHILNAGHATYNKHDIREQAKYWHLKKEVKLLEGWGVVMVSKLTRTFV
jgi:hypothetical protein